MEPRPRPELPSPDGIPLFLPTDEFSLLSDTSFQGPEIELPGLGKVHLEGERAYSYEANDMGITLRGRDILIETAENLRDSGLYELKVGISDMTDPKLLICRMKLHEGTLLESGMFVNKDFERGSKAYCAAYTQEWHRQLSLHPFYFFVPVDPIFLSTSTFTFRERSG